VDASHSKSSVTKSPLITLQQLFLTTIAGGTPLSTHTGSLSKAIIGM
jgi:hypothetical protein